jgi:hypothetical protein
MQRERVTLVWGVSKSNKNFNEIACTLAPFLVKGDEAK